jgi:hypothetical protein
VGAATAAAAAAAGAYWLYGAKDAAKHRKLAKSWMLRARAEVMDAVEKVSEIDKATYLDIVEKVVKTYSSTAGAQSKEIQQLLKDLRGSWAHIQQRPSVKKATKAVKRIGTKAKAKKNK